MPINKVYPRDNYLSEVAKITLKDRYMLPTEESPQDAFARAALAFADDEAHAQRIYDYVSKGWFMYSSPILSNGGTDRGMPISCFTGDTPVLTSSSFKHMEDIKVGDMVMTHKGRTREVTAVMPSVSNDVYELVVNKRRTKLKVTGNHPIYTNLGWVRVDQLNKWVHLVACDSAYVSEDTVKVININNPEPTSSTQFKRTPVSQEVLVDEDLGWALGFWFAEGSTSTGTIKVTNQSKELCQKWVDIMSAKFGINGTAEVQKTWCNGRVHSYTLKDWFDMEFGVGCKVKELPEWLLTQSKDILIQFWNGMYEGDGFKTKNFLGLELSNPKLIAGLHLILNKIGVKHSLQLQKSTAFGMNGIIILDAVDMLSERRQNTPGRGIEFTDGLVYNQIESITKLEGEYQVYDITVDEDHTFIAAGVVAHNCFGGYVDDSREGITDHYTENAWLSSMGGGIGGYWGHVRSNGATISNGGKSTGVTPFIKVVDSQMLAFSQGSNRRGSYAAYLDISHPEILEFIHMRKPTGGDMNRKSLNLHHAVIIPDAFMEAVEKGDMWNLVDPHTGTITDTVDARTLWMTILNTRVETGEPYIMWSDTCNAALPEALKAIGLKVHQSNLCSEIILPTDNERTFVCCLSSVNLEYFEHWAGTPMVADIVRYLDNVLTYFIDNAPDSLAKAKYSAMRSRDIGLGAMGFHSFLQSKNIPFESVMAKVWNKKMFQYIKGEAMAESARLGLERGFAPDLVEKLSKHGKVKMSPYRHSHLLAVAPNATSSIICGTSPSIEPIRANIFTQKTLSGSFEMKNPYLQTKLKELGKDTPEVWSSIIANEGSVQHLDFLSELDKSVFKTADEIDQMWIIEHACDRQPMICQAQSVNLFFSPVNGVVDAAYLHYAHMKAWRGKLKTLYYLRSKAMKRVQNINIKVERSNILDTQSYAPTYEETSCLSCE